jgi:hypothetical protein
LTYWKKKEHNPAEKIFVLLSLKKKFLINSLFAHNVALLENSLKNNLTLKKEKNFEPSMVPITFLEQNK